jgi:abequosyltransferase
MRISIAIPNYRRLEELKICLDSILSQTVRPFEVVIHDDASPNQNEIKKIVNEYSNDFLAMGICIRFIASFENLGYDKSLRRLIHDCQGDYILFIGNDDYLMPDCISHYVSTVSELNIKMVSRNFYKFQGEGLEIYGISKFVRDMTIFSSYKDCNYALRLSAYFGGLLFDRKWALSLDTDRWDGTLYYQFYLALNSFSSGGILCIPYPTVAARSDGIPLFGETDKHKVHSIGRYNVVAREKMWRDILLISKVHDETNSTNYYPIIRHELKVRMSFHLMEMFSSSTKSELISLFMSLYRLKLIFHPVPILFWLLNFTFGRKSRYFYSYIRKRFQSCN